MRFIVMHKVNGTEKADAPPPKTLVDAMGALIGQSMRDGVFQNGAGLTPRFPRVRTRDTKNNLLAGFAMVKVGSQAEAIAIRDRYLKVVGDAELELGRVTEPWEIGVAPKPVAKTPETYLMLHMADAKSEAGTPPTASEQEKMGALIGELSESGVLLAAEGVQPSRLGKRLTFKNGKRTAVLDGPFTESKELIGGFSILKLPDLDAAVEWAGRYGAILENVEVDVLRLHDVAAKG